LYYPVYRLNTYPLLHKNVFHFLLNSIALTPLLERFEMENGTIVTLLLFTGPFGLLPGLIYTGLERFIFRSNSAVIGASIWVFLLLCVEAIKTYRQNPAFTIGDYAIPTWTTPLFIIFVIHFLVPNTSLLGHLCGALVGYLWGLGWIKFLAPSEKILRWVEGKLNLLGRLPHYVSVDQKTYGRYGVLPSTNANSPSVGPGRGTLGAANGVAMGPVGGTQRLGP
jgi:membrane associated rhomboid family serine protease